MKFNTTWGCVVRSPILKRGEAYLMPGDQFEDGLYRVIVGYDVPRETVAEIEAEIEDRDRVKRIVDAVNALMSNHANGSRDE